MHSVENLTHLYRARRYNTRDVWLDYYERNFLLTQLMRGTKPNEWRIYYQPCQVVKITALEIVVISEYMCPEITKRFPDFREGGKFNINKPRLQRDGKALHTRYGEWFHISAPDSAIALGESRELVKV